MINIKVQFYMVVAVYIRVRLMHLLNSICNTCFLVLVFSKRITLVKFGEIPIMGTCCRIATELWLICYWIVTKLLLNFYWNAAEFPMICFSIATELLLICCWIATNLMLNWYCISTELLLKCFCIVTDLLLNFYWIAAELLLN